MVDLVLFEFGIVLTGVGDGEHEAAILVNLPVGFSGFVAVGQEEGVVLAIKTIHLHPPREGDGVERFAIEEDADAVAGALELEGVLHGPAARGPPGTHRSTGKGRVLWLGEVVDESVPTVLFPVLESVVSQQPGVTAVLLTPLEPLLVALL